MANRCKRADLWSAYLFIAGSVLTVTVAVWFVDSRCFGQIQLRICSINTSLIRT